MISLVKEGVDQRYRKAKKTKINKCVAPVFKVCGGLVVVLKRWRTLIGRSRLRICDIDCKRHWYMLNKRVLVDF